MCLAIPGRLARWLDRDPLFARAEIEFDGLRRVCHLACVPDAAEGDYVLVHAGVAISRIAAAEAARLLAELASLNETATGAELESLRETDAAGCTLQDAGGDTSTHRVPPTPEP